MLRILLLIASLFAFAGLAACGGDDDDGGDDAPTATSAPADAGDAGDGEAMDDDDGDAGDGGGDPPSGGSGDGVIEVDGERFDVTSLLRCEPFSEGDDNLDLQAGAAGGLRLFIYVNAGDALLQHELSIQGGGVGVFSGSASLLGGDWVDDDGNSVSGPPFEVGEDRISGSLTLSDARGGDATVDVSFDVAIPGDIEDCSL